MLLLGILLLCFLLWLVMITDQLSSSFECTNFIFSFICFPPFETGLKSLPEMHFTPDSPSTPKMSPGKRFSACLVIQ